MLGEHRAFSSFQGHALVTSPKSIRSLAVLLLGTAFLIMGQGLLLAIVPISVNARGFSAQTASIVGAAYFAGFMAGAWRGQRVIQAVGHIRAYGGLVAVVILAVLLMPFFANPAAWSVLRFAHGFAAGGAFLTIEAWLNGGSEGPWRGRVLAAYMIISLGGLGGAPFLIAVSGMSGATPFAVGGIFFAASIVPVMLTKIDAPVIEPNAGAGSPFLETYRRSPFSFVTSLTAGMSIGAFWTLAPFFAAKMGMSLQSTSALVATTVFSGLALQWPVGYLSGHHDRRKIVVFVTAAAAVALIVALVLMGQFAPGILFVAFAVLGGQFCLYPLSVAHALDNTEGRNTALEMSRGLLMANGLGQTLGPLAAGPFFGLGPQGLIIYFAVVLAGIAAFTRWRMRVGVTVAPDQQGQHIFVRTTTPAGTHLDPRVEDTGVEDPGVEDLGVTPPPEGPPPT